MVSPSGAPRPPADSAEEEVRLTLLELDRRRGENARRHNVVAVPVIRLLGLNAVVVAVFLHHRLIGPFVDTTSLWIFVALVEVYCVCAWLLVVALWERLRPVLDLHVPLTAVDILVCTGATYVTGGERSWLYFVLLLRLADLGLSFRSVLGLAHLVLLAYVGMLAYIVVFDGRTILIGPAFVKTFSLYGSAIYLAMIARIAESLRSRLVSALRTGRDLVRELEDKSASLEYSRHKAEEVSLMKTQFLSTVSHELRTPLTAVLSRTEMLLDEADKTRDAALIEDLRQITAAAQQLAGIINDILDVAKMEAGKMSLFLERFEVAAVVADAVGTVAPLAERAGIRMVVESPAQLGTMHADRARVRQVLLNLLGNGIKFTNAGTVGIGVTRVGGGAAGDVLIFRVWDTGIGMTPEVQSRLFTPFMQSDPSTTRKYGGTGLGLAIAKQFTEMMGGTLSLVSTEGSGSAFTLQIPADIEQALPHSSGAESSVTDPGRDPNGGTQ